MSHHCPDPRELFRINRLDFGGRPCRRETPLLMQRAMLAQGRGTGIGGRNGGRSEGCVSDRICGAGRGGGERRLTVET